MNHGFIAIAGSILLAVVACETAPQSAAALEQARNAVAQAEADPNVARYAPTMLDRARKLLASAQSVADKQGANDKTATHYAYLATQVARISQQRALEQLAISRIKAGETERQKIQGRSSQTESRRVAAQLENLQVSQTSRGIVLTLDDVVFSKGRAALGPGAARSIEQLAAFLKQNPERRVQVEAFNNSQRINDHNIELAQSRADVVAMAIIHRGIDAERVRASGYGEEFPVANSGSPGNRKLNRRVEIIVSKGDDTIPGRTMAGVL